MSVGGFTHVEAKHKTLLMIVEPHPCAKAHSQAALYQGLADYQAACGKDDRSTAPEPAASIRLSTQPTQHRSVLDTWFLLIIAYLG